MALTCRWRSRPQPIKQESAHTSSRACVNPVPAGYNPGGYVLDCFAINVCLFSRRSGLPPGSVGAAPRSCFAVSFLANPRLDALAVLAGWNVVEIPWVRWCSECAKAEHPFMPVRTSFHTVCLGVKHPSHRAAPWCNGATARRRLRVLRVTCNAGDVRCRPWSTTMRSQTAIESAIDGFICHALGPVEDQS